MKKQREHWGSQLGFIMAAAGSAVGLGLLWMFPYVTGKNGGGLFVLLYFAFVLLVAVPLFIAELVIGRRSQKGAVCTFIDLHKEGTSWKIIGWLGAGAAFLIMSYYSVVAGWGLNYVFMSLNQFWEGRTPAEIANVFTVLEQSGDINIFWHFVFTLITALLVYQGVRKGIEHWSRIMTTGLLVLLVALVGYCVTLDGFYEALSFIFTPDLSKFKPSGALDALGMSLLTLSLGQGIMITYGSYMKNQDNLPKVASVVGSMVILIAVMASTMIFTIMFTFAEPGTGAEVIKHSGPGLVFKNLPIIFAKLESGSLIISTAFFVMLVFTALTSAMPLIEVVTTNFVDLYGWSRKKTVILVSTASFIFGIPSALSGSKGIFANWEAIYGISFFETINSLATTWMLSIGAFLFSIFVGWVIDKKMLYEGFIAGTNAKWLFKPWFFLIRWVIPVATLMVILYKGELINFDKLYLYF